MKLVVLADNRANDDVFETEHGLSVYLETEVYTYLLDTGRSDCFIRNAERLGIDLRTVDYVFLSHAHLDHTGGLEAFLAINDKAKVIMSPLVMKQRYYSSRHGGLRELGIPIDASSWQDRLLLVEDELMLEDGSCFYACTMQRFPSPKANSTLWVGSPENVVSDPFEHELVACFGTDHPLLFIGCAHKGVLNIVADYSERFGKEPAFVFGGFHLLDSTIGARFESEEDLDTLANG